MKSLVVESNAGVSLMLFGRGGLLRLVSERALSLKTIASRLAPTGDRIKVRGWISK